MLARFLAQTRGAIRTDLILVTAAAIGLGLVAYGVVTGGLLSPAGSPDPAPAAASDG